MVVCQCIEVPTTSYLLRRLAEKEKLFVAKSRRNNQYLGRSFNYDVDLKTFKITMGATLNNVLGDLAANVAANNTKTRRGGM